MILTREGKNSDVTLGVYLIGFISCKSLFLYTICERYLSSSYVKTSQLNKQPRENVENGLFQAFTYFNFFFKPPVEYIISELKVKLHYSF